jgi:cytochrome c oxidase subunit 4
MTDNMNTKSNSYHKQENKNEMKKQLITFASMIIFTIIAFAIVAADISSTFAIPILLVLAVVQVAFQFFYFMHMKDRGHEVPAALIYGGFFVTFLVMITFTTIIWWGPQ